MTRLRRLSVMLAASLLLAIASEPDGAVKRRARGRHTVRTAGGPADDRLQAAAGRVGLAGPRAAPPSRSRPWDHCSACLRAAGGDLLDAPAVAVGVGEVHEADVVERVAVGCGFSSSTVTSLTSTPRPMSSSRAASMSATTRAVAHEMGAWNSPAVRRARPAWQCWARATRNERLCARASRHGAVVCRGRVAKRG